MPRTTMGIPSLKRARNLLRDPLLTLVSGGGYLAPRMPLSLSRDRITALLSAARSKRVAVIGDAMLDVYLRGDVERISPEAPVPVVRVRERRSALGAARNGVQNVRGVGAQCDLAGAVWKEGSEGKFGKTVYRNLVSTGG